jgi:hypothetical protein
MVVVILKPEFETPGPNFWISTCQAQLLTPIGQIKGHSEGQRKEVYCVTGAVSGRWHFSHLRSPLGYRNELLV